MVERSPILLTAQNLLNLTYTYSVKELPAIINEELTLYNRGTRLAAR